MLKHELVGGIVISNTCVKLYRNWIINEVARAGEHTNERTNVRTYVLTYIRTGQTLYPLHNFVVRGDNKALKVCDIHTYSRLYFLSWDMNFHYGGLLDRQFDFFKPSFFLSVSLIFMKLSTN